MLGLYVVSSELENDRAIRERVSPFIAGFDVVAYASNILQAEAAVSAHKEAISGTVILVASGGTEAIINQIVFQTAKPVLLWANPENNSLAASVEAYAVLKGRFPLKIVYAPLDSHEARESIDGFRHIATAIARIDRGVLGCVGAPSPWLLTSHGIQSLKNFGTHTVSIKLDRLLERFDRVAAGDAQAVVEAVKLRAGNVRVSERDLLNAARLYLAMKDLVTEHELTALTIRCYDLLDSGLTACLGISLCNDEGITAGCEGDIEALFSMVLGSAINTGPTWMADALRIDRDANSLTLSHCTVPPLMLQGVLSTSLVPQPDVGLGVTVQGGLRTGPVTLLRMGRGLSTLLIATGRIIDRRPEGKGRATAEIELSGTVESWLEHAPGNHQVVLYGDVSARALDFCDFKHITPVVI